MLRWAACECQDYGGSSALLLRRFEVEEAHQHERSWKGGGWKLKQVTDKSRRAPARWIATTLHRLRLGQALMVRSLEEPVQLARRSVEVPVEKGPAVTCETLRP